MAAGTSPFLAHSPERVRARADLFHCYLADQPEYLVPQRLFPLYEERSKSGRLEVSPDVWFSWREAEPSSFAHDYQLPDRFVAGPGILWVNDALTETQRPFWAGPWFREKLAGFRKGEAGPQLNAAIERVLRSAGVLVDASQDDSDAERWRLTLEKAALEFGREGFACLPPLLHPFHLGALRRYYRRLLRLGGMALGDSSSAQRYVAYNDSVASFFHRQLARVVSRASGTRVVPTFSYVVSYQGGAELPIHTDRAQCTYAVSMLIDYMPEPEEESPWPLMMQGRLGPRRVWQCLGDAVLYRGTEVPHWRNALPSTATSTSILFYYVNEGFAGSLD